LDGTFSEEGCIFCNNKAFGLYVNKPIPLRDQITQGLEYYKKRFGVEKFIAYFQSYSGTHGDIEFLKDQYSVIKEFKEFVGISISTRPDCIDEAKLDLIEEFSKDYKVYVEYGLQTIHDKTLKLINRNHKFSDFERAVEMTSKRKSISIGAHIILGLPGEDKSDMLATAQKLASMPLWGIKLHSMHIVKNTSLELMHKEGKVKLLLENEYVDVAVSFLEHLSKEFVILRLISGADKDFLIAPSWVNEKQRMLKKIEDEFKIRNTWQGKLV